MYFKMKPFEALFSNTLHSLLMLSSAKIVKKSEVVLSVVCTDSVVSFVMNNKQCVAGTAKKKHVHD